jgi:magnesium chelatase family protein
MLIRTFGSAVHGVNAVTITIEVNVSDQGIGYSLVGLPDNAVKEGKERVETAVRNIKLAMPRSAQ